MTIHPLHAFYLAEHGGPLPEGPNTCWFCAGSCGEGHAVTDVVRSTFNDMARARAGGDGPVCEACAFYLDFKILRPGGKRGMGLFTKTVVLWAGDPPRWSEWEREDMADDLLHWEGEGLPEPMYLTCNYSKQKHVLPWARLSGAGERYPWISTDAGDVKLDALWPALAWCVAWLWSHGYPKTMIGAGQLSAYVLAKSDTPGLDLAASRALAQVGRSPLLDYLTYIVTETNRDRLVDTLAGRAEAIVRGHDAGAADRVAARGDPERGGGSGIQETLSETVVANPGGAGHHRGNDLREPDEVVQLGFL